MELVETAFTPNGDYLTHWEATNITGTSDGIIRIDNIQHPNGAVSEKVYYNDGRQQFRVTGDFTIAPKAEVGSGGQKMATTIMLPDEASSETFRKYYSMGTKELLYDSESTSPNIVMRGNATERGMNVEHVSIFLKNGDRHVHYRLSGNNVDDIDVIYHANGNVYERVSTPTDVTLDGKKVYVIHWKETSHEGIREGDFKAIWLEGKWEQVAD